MVGGFENQFSLTRAALSVYARGAQTNPWRAKTMKRLCLVFLATGLFGAASAALAAPTHYVDLNNPSPVSPYTSWATAATNIQDAVNAALSGELILVTNGVYRTGAVAVYGMSNRVAVTKPVIVQSVNGPAVTTIAGSGPIGAAAVRCVYLTNGAVLAGFTLTNGATQTSGDIYTNLSGGGVWCESASAVVTNCTLTSNSATDFGGGAYYGTLSICTLAGNSASWAGGGSAYSTLSNCTLTRNSASQYGGGAFYGTLNNCALTGSSASAGGGAYYGTLNNCALTGNSATDGGGAYYGTLKNCTLIGNSAGEFGGGAYSATLNNCVVYYNAAWLSGDNYYGATLNFCCTKPLPGGGSGNLAAEPQLAGNWHLSATSPCRGAGSATYATGRDLDGEPWASPPSIGCDEYWSGTANGALSVAIQAAYTNVAVGFAVDFQGEIDGLASASRWDFGDATVVSNRPYATHAWSAPGDYAVELRSYNNTYPGGVASSLVVHVVAQPVHYVALYSTTPVAPYTSWATAATNIQDAVDAATILGALVLVSDGVYQDGAVAVYGMSNRVAVTKPVTVQSVNGPTVTTIVGNGPVGAAVRCVYLTNGTVLAGFTLTNGVTQNTGNSYTNRSGGAVWCETATALVTNCILIGNWASFCGGGAFSGNLINCTLTNNEVASYGSGAGYGTLNNCTLSSNYAVSYGGGAYYSTLNNCTLINNSAGGGGGAYSAILNNCTLTGNSAIWVHGGGAYSGTLNNCTLTGNSAGSGGGGAYSATLNNCTLTGNSAGSGGGTYNGTVNNCTLAGNSAGSGGGASSGTLNNCTLTSNSASSSDGGGAYSAILNNCTLTGNSASRFGGGAFSGTLSNCTLTGNSAGSGGGTENGTLNNCILTGNTASYGGGSCFGTLNNCTLTGNSAATSGGGAYSGTLINCTLTGNSAYNGGGTYNSGLNNCALTRNRAYSNGGGAYSATLYNCTLTGNSAYNGGGAYSGTLNNCIVYYNKAGLSGDNWSASSLNYCCTTQLTFPGGGNFTSEPQLASTSHLSATSPCRGAGSASYATGRDLDGELWASPPSIGCDEYWSGSVTGAIDVAIQAAYTNVAVGFGVNLQGLIYGRVSASRWDFGDGTVVSNRPYAAHAWSTPGDYTVELRAYNNTYPGGVAASLVVHVAAQPVHYVALDSVSPVPPYTSWATAATNIQDAVDAATVPGALVLVGDGVYQTGAVPVYGMSNRVAVTKSVIVQSVNGPAVTTIAGYGPIGAAAMRCVYLTNGAVLAGFTLTNGATQASGNSYTNQSGGAVWCESASVVVTNCMLTGNWAFSYGGGAFSGTLNNCTLTGNSAATNGGGAYYGMLNNCTLTGNSASTSGGGAYYGTLNNCILTGNWASYGGGSYYGTLNNCTLAGNSASTSGGGACYGTLNNCIVYYNSAPSGTNFYSSAFNYSCTTPSPGIWSNITSAPLFVNTNGWSNLRLQSSSPCINAGTNSYVTWAFDLDGQPRITGGRVDMGAYEYHPLDAFHAWLGQYGLPTYGAADYADSDGDGLNNWQEWIAGTNPTNAASALWMLTPTNAAPGVTVVWTSVTNRNYSLEYSTDLTTPAGFSVLRSNLAGLPGTTSFTDTNVATSPRFYRVRVEE